MTEQPSLAELQDRVRQSIAFYSGTMSNDAGLVWDGYFAALLEWGLISVSDHDVLTKMLPQIPGNPVVCVLLGWEKQT